MIDYGRFDNTDLERATIGRRCSQPILMGEDIEDSGLLIFEVIPESVDINLVSFKGEVYQPLRSLVMLRAFDQLAACTCAHWSSITLCEHIATVIMHRRQYISNYHFPDDFNATKRKTEDLLAWFNQARQWTDSQKQKPPIAFRVVG